MPACLRDALNLIQTLDPLEDHGYILALCGSTLKQGWGDDIDVLLIREPETEALAPTMIPSALASCGLSNISPHLGPDGRPDGLGYVGEWRGFRVDIGVMG